LLSLVLEVVVFALNLPLIGIFAFVVHAKTIHKQNWYYHHKRSTEMSQTINEVIEVPAPPKERAPVVHVEQEETAKELFAAKKLIKERAADQDQELLDARAQQKQKKRDLVSVLNVGDQIQLEDGYFLVKHRKRNRDLNGDQLATFMNGEIDEDTLMFIAEHKCLPDHYKVSLLEAGYTFREVLVRAPPPKRVKVKKEPGTE
jgi:hypothetical protein